MSEGVKTGWEPDRRTHFDEIVVSYDKIRPEYPKQIFEDIFAYAGQKKDVKALEIGAGTGKATALFLDADCDVTAVEIGENMVEFLQKRFEKYNGFRAITSSFEDAELEENCYDLIYAASAFHWVDAKIGCPKMFGLLRDGGVCALIRYNFNVRPTDGEELYEEFQELYEKYYYSHYTSNYRPIKLTRELLATPGKLLTGYGFGDLSVYGFDDVSMKFYDAVLQYSADEYLDLLDTMSDHRALPESNRMALYAGIREMIMRQGGCHKVDCIFQLYLGRKP